MPFGVVVGDVVVAVGGGVDCVVCFDVCVVAMVVVSFGFTSLFLISVGVHDCGCYCCSYWSSGSCGCCHCC